MSGAGGGGSDLTLLRSWFLYSYHNIDILSDIMAKLPWIVNLERHRKLYASISIPKMLAENGIDEKVLIPPVIDPDISFNIKTMSSVSLTPLRLYDNTEFDSRRADEWVKVHHGTPLPVPVLVYLPVDSNDHLGQKYEWTEAVVNGYDPEKKMFLVTSSTGVHPDVSRLQIHFKGENPDNYLKRIKYAISRRDFCENIML